MELATKINIEQNFLEMKKRLFFRRLGYTFYDVRPNERKEQEKCKLF